MILKKWHKYVCFKTTNGKKTYTDSIVIPMSDIEVSNDILKNTGYEERLWDDIPGKNEVVNGK